jgi:alcohol dehydrogenase class IV
MWQFISPDIFFGEDALEKLSEIEGEQAFIVTDKTMVELGYVQKVQDLLNMESVVFDEVEPEPSFETVLKGKDMILRTKSDIVIGLGGGSPMDAAKTIRILYEMPDLEIEEITPMTPLITEKTRLILISTSSGTGSEVTTALVLTNKEEVRKAPAINLKAAADIAIVDPSLVGAMPSALAANTAMDALSHAIDAYISEWKNDFSDGLSIKATEIIFRYLPRAYKDRTDHEAVEKMHNAACIAGLAFGNSQAGLSHSMGHALGAVLHWPHGKACGICLPYTIQYEARDPEVMAFLSEFVYHLRFNDLETLIKNIFDLMTTIDIPHSLKDAGISFKDFKDRLDRLVENALFDPTAVTIRRCPSEEELRALFEYAYEGKEVDF